MMVNMKNIMNVDWLGAICMQNFTKHFLKSNYILKREKFESAIHHFFYLVSSHVKLMSLCFLG